jgi:hypothetical protein
MFAEMKSSGMSARQMAAELTARGVDDVLLRSSESATNDRNYLWPAHFASGRKIFGELDDRPPVLRLVH